MTTRTARLLQLLEALHQCRSRNTGGTDDGAPGSRPHYGPEHYGCFVRDLDGHKIEAMAWLENPTP